MNRIFTLLLALFAIATAAQAQFGGGDGSVMNPYLISTTDHLDQLAANVNAGNSYQGEYFLLEADLDYAGKTYTPIGSLECSFAGTFDGWGHSINNVTLIVDGFNVGLFGSLNVAAMVHRLKLGGNSRIEGHALVGGIAGYMQYSSTIANCEVGADVVVAARSGSADIGTIGGIVGGVRDDVILRTCVSRATVTDNNVPGCSGIGGIVGEVAYDVKIEDCVSFSTIVGTNDVGGIVGSVSAGTPTVTNCQYTNFSGGGIQGADSEGAAHMGRISFGDGFTSAVPLSYIVYNDGGTYYCKDGANLQLYLTADMPGWTCAFFGNGAPLSPDGNNRYSVTMPTGSDLLVTVAKDKRLISYEPWVSVSIPPQEYTGSPLTPAVTVTDSMGATPVTLTEGVHYTVSLPASLTAYGYYDITITGIGAFTGQTTARFTITPPLGTEENPIIIRTTDEMDVLAAGVNGGVMPGGQYIVLDADLDYTGKTYTPVGTEANPFQGNFNANGHSISNVVIDTNANSIGLFGVIDAGATVTDLCLGEGSSIAGNNDVGGIAGKNFGTIIACYVRENVAVSGNYSVGGIVGSNSGGTVTACLVSKNVTVSASSQEAGGIVGSDATGTIAYCVNNSRVSAAQNLTGGIVGKCTNSSLSDNLNLGAVIVNGNFKKNTGGITAMRTGGTFVNNLWAGNCEVEGVGNRDVDGARKGTVVTVNRMLECHLVPSPDGDLQGIVHDGITYVNMRGISYFVINGIPGVTGVNIISTHGALIPLSSDYYRLTLMAALDVPSSVKFDISGIPTVELLDDDHAAWPDNVTLMERCAGTICNVVLKGRTFYKDGEWNTLCLPFDFKQDGFANEFFARATIMILDPKGKNGFDPATGTLHLTFQSTKSYGTPGSLALVKWDSGEDIIDPTFMNKIISTSSAKNQRVKSDGLEPVEFRGLFTSKYLTGGDRSTLFLAPGNQLMYAEEARYLLPFRGYFHVDESTAQHIRSYSLDFGDGPVTTLTPPTFLAPRQPQTYDLQGRRVTTPQKGGVYIVNGKKVLF